MIYREVNNNSRMWVFGYIGLLFIIVSVGIAVFGIPLALYSNSEILGVQVAQTKTKAIQEPNTLDTSEPVKDTGTTETTTIETTQQEISDPIQVEGNEPQRTTETVEEQPKPTAVPLIIEPTPTPPKTEKAQKIIDESNTETNEINVSDADTEIIIKNEQNELVVTTEENSEIIRVPAEETETVTEQANETSGNGNTAQDPVKIVDAEPTNPPNSGTSTTTTTESTGSTAHEIFKSTTSPTAIPQGGTTTSSQTSGTTQESLTSSTSQNVEPIEEEGFSLRRLFGGGQSTMSQESDSGSSQAQRSGSTFDRLRNFVSSPFARFTQNNVSQTTRPRPVGPSSSMPPASAIKITYTANTSNIDLDRWLADYQFQVWPVGENNIAIHRNGVTAITPYAIKLGLSKLSFSLITEQGVVDAPYYFDNVVSYIRDLRLLSEGAHLEPVEIVMENNELIYRIEGDSNQLLLAAFPTNVCYKFIVKAQTREVRDSKACSPLDSAIDLVSLTL